MYKTMFIVILSLCLLFPAFSQQEKLYLAILDVTVKKGEETKGSIVYQYIMDRINRAGKFAIVEREALDKAIKELKVSTSDIMDESTAIKIGKMSGARFILISSLIKEDNLFYLSIRVVSIETGKVERTSVKKTGDFNKIEELVKEAVDYLFIDDTATPVPISKITSAATPYPKQSTATPKPTVTPTAMPASLVRKGMVFIQGGTFDMGDTFGDAESKKERVHKVTVSNFYMGQNEVTFEEYDKFCQNVGKIVPYGLSWGKASRPVIFVSWYDTIEYCNWLSVKDGLTPCYLIDKTHKDPDNLNIHDELKWIVICDFTAFGYRLPTETEWEYAAREGGMKVRFGNSKDIADPKEINFQGQKAPEESYAIAGVFREKTMPVGYFKPNSLGLYDMSGNVCEWCWDWYEEKYQKSPQSDYKGPVEGESRILRGGAWLNTSYGVRATYRNDNWPYLGNNYIGFRLVCSAGVF